MTNRKKWIMKAIALTLFIVMSLQMTYTSVFGAYIVEMTGLSTNSTAKEYTDIQIYSGTHSVSAGRAGTFTMDDYRLTLSGSFDALTIDTGSLSGVSIDFTYGSKEYHYLKNIAGITAASYGGWLTNYNTFVSELNYEDKKQIAWFNGDEKALLFEQTNAVTTEEAEYYEMADKWIPLDEEYDDLVLWSLREGEQTNLPEDMDSLQYGITIDNQITYAFDSLGRQVGFVDTATQSVITTDYVSENASSFDAISKLTDGAGNEFRFSYSDGKLTKIKCYDKNGAATVSGSGEYAAPLEMTFSYANGYLAEITYPDGEKIHYTYDSSGLLCSARNIDDTTLLFGYDNGNISSVQKKLYDWVEEAYVLSYQLTITVQNNNTIAYTDKKGDTLIKTFDNFGKLLTIADEDGNILYGANQSEEGVTGTEVGTTIPLEPMTEATCPCEDCIEPDCACQCPNEDSCTCITCKRKYVTITDTYGNITSQKAFDGSKVLSEINTYTQDGAYMASSTDSAGNTVYYAYDSATGFLDSLSAGDTQIDFSYDAMGNLTKLAQDVSGLTNGNQMTNEYTYANDQLTSITHNGFSYTFEYDVWGNQTKIKIGSQTLTENEYAGTGEDGQLTKVTYANGQTVTYSYNANGQITGVSSDGGETDNYTYSYDMDGNLEKITDHLSSRQTMPTDTGEQIRRTDDNSLIYDLTTNEDGTITETIFGDALTLSPYETYNNQTGITESGRSFDLNKTWTSNSTTHSIDAENDLSITKDWFGRTIKRRETFSGIVDSEETELERIRTYHYADTDTTASQRVTGITTALEMNGTTTQTTEYYEYDAIGNVTGIYHMENSEKIYDRRFFYDEANQLIREDNRAAAFSAVFTYNTGGNLVSRSYYPFTLGEITEDMTPDSTTTYSYNHAIWKDVLTAVNGSPVVTDAMGNITQMNGVTYTWTAGRLLQKAEKNGIVYTYTYDHNGFLSKCSASLDTITYTLEYLWDDAQLLSMYFTITSGEETNSAKIQMLYDSDSNLVGYIYDGIGIMLFADNLIGEGSKMIDVVSGDMIEGIKYDAFGGGAPTGFDEATDSQSATASQAVTDPIMNIMLQNATTAEIAAASTQSAESTLSTNSENENTSTNNNLGETLAFIATLIGGLMYSGSYKGYALVPTADGFFYTLGTRMYSPVLGRFMSADIHTDTQQGAVGTNMFAYCNNNPTSYSDPTGEATISSTFIIGLLAIVLLTVFLSLAIHALFSSITITQLSRTIQSNISSLNLDTDFYAFIKNIPNEIADYLDDAIAKAIAKSKKIFSRLHNHHIVAKTAPEAELSRRIIRYAGIGVDTIYNLVYLKDILHNHLHSYSYYDGVTLVLLYCYMNNHTYNMQQMDILAGLTLIKIVLLAANNMI